MTAPYRRVVAAVMTALAMMGLAASFHLDDPHLLPVRAGALPALLLLTAMLGWATRLIASVPLRAAVRVLLLTAAASGIANTLFWHYQKHAVLSADGATARALGARFIVGYRERAALEPLVARGLVGGVFITRRNVRGKSMEAVRADIAHLQQLRRLNHLPPLVVATDQEGGAVSRLSPPLPAQPSLAGALQGVHDAAERGRVAFAYGQQQGRGLADLGVTLNLSPVVDLKPLHAPSAADWHSRIDTRAISPAPEVVAQAAEAYVQGLASQGVGAALKHFPGLGRVKEDTHHFSARLDTPPDTLAQSDWRPFREVAARTGAAIMLGHVIYEPLDPERPASSSPAVVQGLIRAAWGFKGRLITDDLTMAAAYNRGLCTVTQDALKAGVDLLLISYDDDKIYPALYCALKTAS